MKRTVVCKNRFILFGMMVMALLFISGCSGDDLTPKSSKGEVITYLADPTPDAVEVWGMRPDGTEKTMLVDNPSGNAVQQTLSPDGRTLVYVLQDSGGQMVSKVLETGEIKILVDGQGSSFDPTPSYSYDGTKIVYCMNHSVSEYGIRVMNADGTDIKVLTETSNDTTPAFNRDGTKIVFDRGRNGSIMVMNADGTDLTVVKADGEGFSYGHPQFLPDGRIVCMKYYSASETKDIVIMNADGSNEINLTPDTDDSSEFSPTVNNAGDKIAFATDRNDEGNIYVGTLSGNTLTNLQNLTADVDYDCWRPRFGAIPIMP